MSSLGRIILSEVSQSFKLLNAPRKYFRNQQHASTAFPVHNKGSGFSLGSIDATGVFFSARAAFADFQQPMAHGLHMYVPRDVKLPKIQ